MRSIKNLTEPVWENVTESNYGVSAFLTKLIVMNHLMANKKNPGDEVSPVPTGWVQGGVTPEPMKI